MFGAAAAEEKGGGNSHEGNAIQEYSRVFFKDFFLEEKKSGNQFYIPLLSLIWLFKKICYNRCTNHYLLTAFGSELPQPHQLGSWRLLFGLPGFPGENGCCLPFQRHGVLGWNGSLIWPLIKSPTGNIGKMLMTTDKCNRSKCYFMELSLQKAIS